MNSRTGKKQPGANPLHAFPPRHKERSAYSFEKQTPISSLRLLLSRIPILIEVHIIIKLQPSSLAALLPLIHQRPRLLAPGLETVIALRQLLDRDIEGLAFGFPGAGFRVDIVDVFDG